MSDIPIEYPPLTDDEKSIIRSGGAALANYSNVSYGTNTVVAGLVNMGLLVPTKITKGRSYAEDVTHYEPTETAKALAR